MSGGKGNRRRTNQKKGLFDDLEGLPDSDIDERLAALKVGVEAAIKEQNRVKQERDAEIKLVQSLRSIQETTRGFSKERSVLLNEFRKIREEAKKIKTERDEINENVPPLWRLLSKEWLKHTADLQSFRVTFQRCRTGSMR